MLRTTKLATAIAAVSLSLYGQVVADSQAATGVFDKAFNQTTWDKFAEDSSFDFRVRMSHFDLSPNRGTITKSYSKPQFVEIASAMRVADPSTLSTLLSGALTADQIKGMSDTALRTFINDNISDAAVGAINQGLSSSLTDEVKNDGDVRETGFGLWTHFRSGYLYDVIGFDLGTNGGRVVASPGTGSKLAPHDGRQNMSRLSIANVKLRFGDEDRHIGLRHGRMQLDLPHFMRDPHEWLMDYQYKGTMVSGKWDSLEVYGLDLKGYSETNQEDFIDIDDVSYFQKADFNSTYSLGADYKSDYGNLKAETTWSDNYMRTNILQVETGLPLSMLGMDVPEGRDQDYMLVLLGSHSWQKAEGDFENKFGMALPDHKSTATDIVLGLQYDALFVGVGALKVGNDGFYNAGVGRWGGGMIDLLSDETLINEWDNANQTTYSLAIAYNWKNFGLDGLNTSMIHSRAKDIDMDQVLANGDVSYYLTGKDSYEETIFEVKYAWTEGPLSGFTARIAGGYETNQAELEGFGIFLTYDAVLF